MFFALLLALYGVGFSEVRRVGAAGVPGSVVINEIMPASGSSVRWVELYMAIDVSDWRLRRGSANVGTIFAAHTILAPHSFTVRESTSSSLPASSGATPLQLLDGANGTVIDSIVWSPIGAGQSYARIPDGGQEWHMGSPTKLATNTPAPIPDTESPTVPQLLAPVNNTVVTAAQESFVWRAASDNIPTGITYELRAATHSANGVIDDGLAWHSAPLTTTEMPLRTITALSDGAWLWQVRSVDAANNKSDWSELGHVTIDSTAPTISIVAPVAGL